MRLLIALLAIALTGCGPGLVFNNSQQMTSDEMLARADHVFIGVIEKQELEHWPFLKIPGQDSSRWGVLRRRIRIENTLIGTEPSKLIDIYEYVWIGGTTGDWNSTQDDRRYLFLTRIENGRYHVVRDWWRSIFPIYSGRHQRLPLDDRYPFWERIGLLSWWVGEKSGLGDASRTDLSRPLGRWRTAKLARGLVRHPDRETRVFGCQVLLLMGRLQDECWYGLSPEDRAIWSAHGLIGADRLMHSGEGQEIVLWERAVAANDLDEMRLLTTANRPSFRSKFCSEFQQLFPNDDDNGCPADRPPPATIVTEAGEVPLIGPWPR